MPIYEYQCEKCGNIFDELQSGFEERTMECPDCGGDSKRVISNTSFVLKGSGWYVTDYAGKNPSNGNEGGSEGAEGNGQSAGESGGDAKPAKSEAKSDSASPGSSS